MLFLNIVYEIMWNRFCILGYEARLDTDAKTGYILARPPCYKFNTHMKRNTCKFKAHFKYKFLSFKSR
jgi:hypothetical protein